MQIKKKKKKNCSVYTCTTQSWIVSIIMVSALICKRVTRRIICSREEASEWGENVRLKGEPWRRRGTDECEEECMRVWELEGVRRFLYHPLNQFLLFTEHPPITIELHDRLYSYPHWIKSLMRKAKRKQKKRKDYSQRMRTFVCRLEFFYSVTQ